MFVTDTETGEKHRVEIGPVTLPDFSIIRKSKEYRFDWQIYMGKEVYKLSIKGDRDILGLIHIESHPEFGFDYLEIVAIEIGLEQQGKGKRYDRVAGCLIGFAARLSFKNGHEGMLFLIAKTEKARLFHSKYGFQYLGNIGVLGERMASMDKNSLRLIKDYLRE